MNRQVNKDTDLLTQLQTDRQALEAKQKKDAVHIFKHFTRAGKPWVPADFGFVWSVEEIRVLADRRSVRGQARGERN